jgi:phosphate starvation-inducible PhoH-like protein
VVIAYEAWEAAEQKRKDAIAEQRKREALAASEQETP